MSATERRWNMGALERYQAERRTSREIERVRARAELERQKLDGQEANRAYIADTRINNGYLLASRTASRAEALNYQITESTRDKPGLEMQLRRLENVVGLAAESIIYGYMTRP
jgi:hypothetical protein